MTIRRYDLAALTLTLTLTLTRYEGGVRSPTMALWPGTIPAGGQSAYRWAFWDVIPTFLQLAGVHPPPGLDGVSIVPTLLGEPQPPKDFLYWTAKGDMPDPTPEDMVCYATSNPNPDPNSNPNPNPKQVDPGSSRTPGFAGTVQGSVLTLSLRPRLAGGFLSVAYECG